MCRREKNLHKENKTPPILLLFSLRTPFQRKKKDNKRFVCGLYSTLGYLRFLYLGRSRGEITSEPPLCDFLLRYQGLLLPLISIVHHYGQHTLLSESTECPLPESFQNTPDDLSRLTRNWTLIVYKWLVKKS